MRYTDLIFDLYGTLVDIHTEESDKVWEKTALYFSYHGAGYSGIELKEKFEEKLALRKVKAGQSYECFPDIPFEQIFEELFCAKGVLEKAKDLAFNASQLFRICSTEYIRLYPYVKEALEILKKSGCRLWLLSNAQRVFTEYELSALDLNTVFDGIYISSDYGFRKPDSRFFNALIAEQNLNVKNCLMIGNDRETDIAGAKAVGLDTLYMHTKLTPKKQKRANPKSSKEGSYEFCGNDWQRLLKLILELIKKC